MAHQPAARHDHAKSIGAFTTAAGEPTENALAATGGEGPRS